MSEKPGPKGERLNIGGDPKKALDGLLDKGVFYAVHYVRGAEYQPGQIAVGDSPEEAKEYGERIWKEEGWDASDGSLLLLFRADARSSREIARYNGFRWSA